MMNPGSSRPFDHDNEINQQVLQKKDIAKMDIRLVPAKPDVTQYQIMRIMNYFKWQYVQVLNLSDLRCANSSDFMKKVAELGPEKIIHSIFSEERKKELIQKLKRKDDAPLICAWGLNHKLMSLIDLAVKRLKNEKIIGLERDCNMYCHPLPQLQSQKEKWVENMVDLLKKGYCNLAAEEWIK